MTNRKLESVLDHKGRINKDIWNVFVGLEQKIQRKLVEGQSDATIK